MAEPPEIPEPTPLDPKSVLDEFRLRMGKVASDEVKQARARLFGDKPAPDSKPPASPVDEQETFDMDEVIRRYESLPEAERKEQDQRARDSIETARRESFKPPKWLFSDMHRDQDGGETQDQSVQPLPSRGQPHSLGHLLAEIDGKVAPLFQRRADLDAEIGNTVDLTRSPTMADFLRRVRRYRQALRTILRYLWSPHQFLSLMGAFISMGALVMTSGYYLGKEIFYLLVIGLLAMKAIHDHWQDERGKEIAAILIATSVLIFTGLVSWTEWQKRFERPAIASPSLPLTVSPPAISLITTKGHKSIQEIFIHNPSAIAYYDIWVKVTADSPAINTRKVEVHRIGATPVNLASDPAEALDNCLITEIPAPGARSFLFSVGRLMPSQTKRYVVSYQNDGELSGSVSHRLAFALDKSTTIPGSHGGYAIPEDHEEKKR